MNWKCKLGFHDYVEVRYAAIGCALENWLDKNTRECCTWDLSHRIMEKYFGPYSYNNKLFVKICVRCGKIVDETTGLEKDFEEMYYKFTGLGKKRDNALKMYKDKINELEM